MSYEPVIVPEMIHGYDDHTIETAKPVTDELPGDKPTAQVEEKPDVYIPDYDGRLQIGTFNTHLARGYVGDVDTRLLAAVDAAANMPADVVCL